MDLYEVKTCALLHDVGKPECWANSQPWWKHVVFTRDTLEPCLGGELAEVAMRHHMGAKYEDHRPQTDEGRIIHVADIMASGADRPEDPIHASKLPKLPIQLSHVLSRGEAVVSDLGAVDLMKVVELVKVSLEGFSEVFKANPYEAYFRLFHSLSQRKPNQKSLLDLPAYTEAPINDHSLWDHLRLVSAFTTCIFLESGYRGGEPENYGFAVVSGDTDKIGSFVGRALRLPDLRAASRMAKEALEQGVDVVKGELGPDCLIYYGGGNFLAVAPPSMAENLARRVCAAFENHTQGELTITISTVNVDGGQIKDHFNGVWAKAVNTVREMKVKKVVGKPVTYGSEVLLCDRCRVRPAKREDLRFTLLEYGARRSERLCDVCWNLRYGKYAGGRSVEDHTDRNDFIAIVKVDGDSMGDVLEGTVLGDVFEKKVTPGRLASISRVIQEECEENLRNILEDKYGGECIYAGGDDLLGVVRGIDGLSCARELMQTFYGKMANYATMSGGVAIVKSKFPFYMALDATSQLLTNAKHNVSDGAKLRKFSVDFEVVFQAGLLKEDFAYDKRLSLRGFHVTHRPYAFRELPELFELIDLIRSGRVVKSQVASVVGILAASAPETKDEQLRKALLFVKGQMGRGYVDWRLGERILGWVGNGMVCDASSLLTVYGR